ALPELPRPRRSVRQQDAGEGPQHQGGAATRRGLPQVDRGADRDHRLGRRTVPSEGDRLPLGVEPPRRARLLSLLRAPQGSDREEAHDVGARHQPHHHQGAHAGRGADAEVQRDGEEPPRLGLLRELRGRRAQVRRQQPLEGLTGGAGRSPPPPVNRTLESIFRPFEGSGAERSDRSAGDRARHRLKVRESIRENIADIIAEESIIGKDRDKVIKVPIRGIREYKFVYGDNVPGVGQGTGESQNGQVVGKAKQPGKAGEEKAGDQPGSDYYETDVTLEELIDIMFEDLELPDLERKALRQLESFRIAKRKGYRAVGIRVRLDKRRTARERVRRKLATSASRLAREKDAVRVTAEVTPGTERRFPFHEDDLTYRHMITDVKKESNAVVICIMDTSGSMDTMKKYLARSFFFLLYQFICTKYRNVEIVFIAHHTEA